jgi:hypothetical protein
LHDSTQLPLVLGLQHCAPVSVLRQQHWSAEQVSFPQLDCAISITRAAEKPGKE